MSNRFDFEQSILQCWNVTSDIDTIIKQYDLTELSQDDVQNALIGLKTVYDFKFQQLFNQFEDMINKGKII